MKKKSLLITTALVLMFCIQLSFTMGEDGDQCCYRLYYSSDDESTINELQSTMTKSEEIIPINVHYHNILQRMPTLEGYNGMAKIIEIVNNAKNKHQITEQQLGLFTYQQPDPQNLNKKASLVIALIELYNKEIEDKKMHMYTKTEAKINVQINTASHKDTRNEPTNYSQANFKLAMLGLKKQNNEECNECAPEQKLAIRLSSLENTPFCDTMADYLYKKDDTTSTNIETSTQNLDTNTLLTIESYEIPSKKRKINSTENATEEEGDEQSSATEKI
jgi:hypothetical protein